MKQPPKKKPAHRRLALLHHDGSVTVLADDCDMEGAEAARRTADAKVRNLTELSVIGEVEIAVLKEYPRIATPAPVCPCPHCQQRHG